MKLRFSIRDLLWFSVVVALILGWSIDHMRIGRAVEDMKAIVSMAERGGAMDKATLQQYQQKIVQLQKRLAETGN